MRHLIAAALVILMPLASLAAPPQTAVLDVQNMTCGLCPVTVKKSLEKVAGVSQAQIDFARKLEAFLARHLGGEASARP